jgi:hypothetical protein
MTSFLRYIISTISCDPAIIKCYKIGVVVGIIIVTTVQLFFTCSDETYRGLLVSERQQQQQRTRTKRDSSRKDKHNESTNDADERDGSKSIADVTKSLCEAETETETETETTKTCSPEKNGGAIGSNTNLENPIVDDVDDIDDVDKPDKKSTSKYYDHETSDSNGEVPFWSPHRKLNILMYGVIFFGIVLVLQYAYSDNPNDDDGGPIMDQHQRNVLYATTISLFPKETAVLRQWYKHIFVR